MACLSLVSTLVNCTLSERDQAAVEYAAAEERQLF